MTGEEQIAQALAEIPAQFMPSYVSWWPIAIGWWLLVLATLFFLLWFLISYVRQRKKTKVLRDALQALKTLESQVGLLETNSQRFILLSRVSAVLRKTTNSYFKKPIFSTQSGNEWRKGLDTLSNTDTPIMSDEAGNVFDKLYNTQNLTNSELQNAIDLSRKWLMSIKVKQNSRIKKMRPIKLHVSNVMLDKQQDF